MKLNALLDLVLIDLYQCLRERLLHPQTVQEGMIRAAELMGAQVIAHSFHAFEPWGVSGTVTIAESHLAVHTWPEYDFAAVTFETCGRHLDHRKAYEHLVRFFGAKRPIMSVKKRGFMELSNDENCFKQEVV